ncbi:MAG: hypothetical protein ACI4PC_02335 [Oscillospiraceae bacterium]
MTVHSPKSEEGRQALARRAAAVHADLVCRAIQKLPCPSQQKARLLDAVIEAVGKEKDAAQTR